MNIHDCTHALVRAIRSCPEYEAFQAVQKQLQGDNSAKKMLTDLRRAQWNIHKQKLAGMEVAPEQEEQLSRLIEVANLNLIIRDYLEAEYKFSTVLNDVQKILGEAMQDIIPPECIT